MCGCTQKRIVNTTPASTGTASGNGIDTQSMVGDVIPTQMVQVEYIGPLEQDFSIRSRVDPGVSYRFGNNPYNRQKTVYLGDAHFLTSLTMGDGQAQYRIVGTNIAMEHRDPSSFIGEAVAA